MPAAIAQFTITDYNDITVGATAPSSPSLDQLWMNTSVTPNRLSRWSGSTWVLATPTTAANVGAEASIYKQASSPAHSSGRLWLQTGVVPNILWRSTGTTWEKVTPTTPSEVGAYPNGDGDNLATRVSTAEQKITSDAIKTTVETEVSANGSSILATKSDITQTEDAWTAKFTLAGGENHVMNGIFKNGISYYSLYYNNDPTISYRHQNNSWTGNEDALEMVVGVAGKNMVMRTLMTGLVKGKTYTVGGLIAGHRSHKKLMVVNEQDTAVIAQSSVVGEAYGGDDLSGWVVNAVTFIATGPNAWLRISLDAVSANGYLWARELRCVEGTVLKPYTPHSSEIYDGIVKINSDGVSVSKSTSEISTQLSHDGLAVNDGTTILAAFGGSGAVIPQADIEKIVSSDVIQPVKAGTYSVGSGKTFSSIGQALSTIFSGGKKHLLGTVILEIYGSLSENVEITNLSGGALNLKFMNGAILNGFIYAGYCTSNIIIYGSGGNGVIASTGYYAVRAQGCLNFRVGWMNTLGTTISLHATDGTRLLINDVDTGSTPYYAVMADYGSEVLTFNNRGSNTVALEARNGAVIRTTNSIGTGVLIGHMTSHNRVTSSSTYQVPPVTAKTFIQVFTAASFDTLQYGTSNVDPYYGASACQNRWDSNMNWKQGRIRVGSEVYNFYNGGSSISMKVRLRRKNTTHGNSGAVVPAGIGTFATGALRGGWTSWATVSSALFGSGGADLRLYNGVSGVNGYAIWDAIEVEVTVTKNV